MNRIILSLVLLILSNHSFGQTPTEKIAYVLDSILVKDDPEEGDSLIQSEVAYMTVIKNKDSLAKLGYPKYEGAVYVFTKEYQNRPDSLKNIPSSKGMERKNGMFLYRNQPYSGRFIDYYYNGSKRGDGAMLNGKLNGTHRIYFHNSKLLAQREYRDGIENGLEMEYYEDGSIKQKGEIVNGNENGVWNMYFPNGQIKQQGNFINGEMEGETTIYYSTGKIYAVELTKNGKTSPDKRLEKIEQMMDKGHRSIKEEDYKNAIKYYSKAIELDSTYAEAYYSRGTVKLDDFQFDEAIVDLDKALTFEPYLVYALSNRAFARIRKYEFASSRTISKNKDVTILASKDKVSIPEAEQEIICNDLKRAILLGDKSPMVKEAFANYCGPK